MCTAVSPAGWSLWMRWTGCESPSGSTCSRKNAEKPNIPNVMFCHFPKRLHSTLGLNPWESPGRRRTNWYVCVCMCVCAHVCLCGVHACKYTRVVSIHPSEQNTTNRKVFHTPWSKGSSVRLSAPLPLLRYAGHGN